MLKIVNIVIGYMSCIRYILSASNITWEPTKIPLVFGKDVGIRCTYHNTLPCNDPISWTWYTGTNNDLILTNGTLTEEFKSENKYSEITSACLKVSTLIVSNFNENDYNQKYTCGIANHKQSGHLFAENIKSKITFAKTPYECKFIYHFFIVTKPKHCMQTKLNVLLR